MDILRWSWSRLRSLWRRRAVKQEIDEELRFHLEQRMADNLAAGMSPADAAREARKRFGNWQSVREDCRDARGASFGETVWQDVRFGARMLRKNPGFTALAVLTLALGVAGNFVIFSIYNAFYLRPFPFQEPTRLVDLDATAPRWNLPYTGLSYPEFDGWRKNNRSFESMAAWCYDAYNLTFENGAQRVMGARVTHDLMSVLKIQPALGRPFRPDEDRVGGAKVLLLAHSFWKRQFGGREDVVGQTLRLNREAYTIIGVLPPDKTVLVENDFWVPMAYDTRAQQGWHLRGVGRLKDGVTLEAAGEDLRRVHQGMVEDKSANENTSPRLTSLGDRFFGGARLMIRVLLGAVAVVLLIASGNVAALMLARGLARSRELGLRLSLGATRWRLARLIGVETLLLAGLGGLAGLLLGYWGLQVFLNSLAERPPRWVHFDPDWRVLAFAGLMVAAAAVLGSLPVIRSAWRLDLRAMLQSSAQQSTAAGGGRRSLRTLVVAEMALTTIMMVQAALLLQTFRCLQEVDPGFRAEHVLVYEIGLPEARYASREGRQAFFQDHLERVRALPGVVCASAITAPPLGGHWGNLFKIEDAPPKGPNEPDPIILQRVAFPGYFETLSIPILKGRAFAEPDGINDGSRAVIVNETFAKRFWPDQDPLGKRISHQYPNAPWMKVVGVAKDVKHYGLDQPMIPGVYLPYAQDPQGQMAVVVRSSVAPLSLVTPVRDLMRQADPDLPMFGVVSMEDRVSRSLWVRRLSASLFGIFAAVAMLMAAGGIYGVFAYIVNRRTPEIGVRLALGAQRQDVCWLIVRQGLALAATGIALGLVGALAVGLLARSLFYGVSPFDLTTLAGIALFLAGVALLACWLPARRAARIEPVRALRCE